MTIQSRLPRFVIAAALVVAPQAQTSDTKEGEMGEQETGNGKRLNLFALDYL
jgi:hypothetical protein